MAVRLAPSARQQFLDTAGNPYVGAKLFTYLAGTSTKQATYTTSIGDVANTNPIILDAAGRTPSGLWLTEGADYKFVLAPAFDTDPPASPIYTEDDISTLDLARETGAGLVGFSHAETYTAGTLGAAKKKFVCVTDAPYNASGDGVTDDTAAIQAAIDSVSVSGTLYFPDGTYKVTSSLICDDRFVNFVGSGRASTIINYVPAVAGGVLFSLVHTPQLAKSFGFADLSISTSVVSAGTAIKIEGKLTAEPVIVSGQHDSLFIERVRIIQSGTGYWTTFVHSKNNGGVHFKTTAFDNSLTSAQGDVNVTGVILEGTVDRISMIRSLVADDFYILRTNIAILTKAVSPKQVESLYLSNGEIVGCRSAGLKYEGPLGAIGLTHVHFDCNSYVIDGRSGEMLIANFAGCDFRKGETTGLANIAGPMIALDYGETVAFSGCVFSGFNHLNSSILNRGFAFSTTVRAQAIIRTSITGCTFRNLYSVFGPSGNGKMTTSGNVYNAIEGVVMEDENTSTVISLRDAFVSKTINISLTAAAEQTVSVAVPDKYWGQRWPVAFLQAGGNTGTDNFDIRYDLDTSTPTSCIFVIRGSTYARPVRFSFLAMGTVEAAVAT